MPQLTRNKGRATLVSVFGAAALTLLAAFPVGTPAAATCDRVAAAGGNDNAAGTAEAPFGSARRLAGSLAPGQTGCVRGALTGDVTVERAGVTITSEPGQRGKILGQLKIWMGADGVTIRDLDLNGGGSSRPSPAVYANDVAFLGNDITNDKTFICFALGTYGHDGNIRVERVRIEGNRIHDCGRQGTNQQHAIYVEHTKDARIVGNEIYDNADRGIQLYPNARGTLIAGNVIDGNGVGTIFGGSGDSASSDNTVRNNVITNPTTRNAVESWYPEGTAPGTGNVVHDNCISGGISTRNGGFTERDNIDADPGYANRSAKDFRMQSGSRCAEILAGGRAGAIVPPPADEPPVAAPLPRPAPKPSVPRSGDRKLRVSLKQKRGRRTLRLRVKLLDRVAAPVRTVLEYRYRGRSWKGFASTRLSRKTFRTTVRLPRNAGKVQVRAKVVQQGARVVATLTSSAPKTRRF